MSGSVRLHGDVPAREGGRLGAVPREAAGRRGRRGSGQGACEVLRGQVTLLPARQCLCHPALWWRVSQVELVAQVCCRTLVVLLLRQPDPTAASASSSHPNLHLHSKSKVRVVAAMGVCACVVEALHLFPSSVQVAIHTL